ncbi:integrase [Streptomyces sp. Ag109_O5-1]|nr:integrase [Streptomyces sp. Ag109_O5-1]
MPAWPRAVLPKHGTGVGEHLLSLHPSSDGIGLRSGNHAVRSRAARPRPVRLPAAGGLPWTFAVDIPAPHHRRTTVRRGGFTSPDGAEAALRTFLEGEAGGFNADPNQTVAGYLNTWLAAKAPALKPTTMARYRDYVHNDLVPAFGSLRLDDLRHRHISAFVTGRLAAGRGRTTLYRCSSALGDAVRQHRLAHNPASPPALRRPLAPERRIWTADEAVRFLRHCHQADPDMADLFEFLIGSGLRKGEALGLHWDDVHLTERVLYVRCTLSAIDTNHLVITAPKTLSSKNWVAISPRVASALRRRARATDRTHRCPGDPFAGLVFCRPDGRPPRPHSVLDRLRQLSEEADVPRVTVHDLRHLAATLTITAACRSPWSPRPCAAPLCRPRPTSTATSPGRPTAGPRWRGCDHRATTSTGSARPSTDCAPSHRRPSAPPQTGPNSGLRPYCDHQPSQNTKSRPPANERTASDLHQSWSGRQDLNLRPLDPQE